MLRILISRLGEARFKDDICFSFSGLLSVVSNKKSSCRTKLGLVDDLHSREQVFNNLVSSEHCSSGR